MSRVPPSLAFKIDTGANSFKPQTRSTALPISLNPSSAQPQLYGGLTTPTVPLGIAIKSWVPTNFRSLTLWLDATALYTVGLSSGTTNVLAWGDRSGNNNDATASTVKPTISYNAINGLPAIYCNASASGGSSSSSIASYFTGSTANFTGSYLHTFAVATMATSSCTFGRILSLARPGVADVTQADTCYPLVRNNGAAGLVNGRGNNSGATATIPNYDVAFLAQSYQEPNNQYIGVNGALTLGSAGSGQGGAFNITAYGVGSTTAQNDTVGFHTGYIGEVIYYTRQMSRYEIQTVEGYLAWKWGLQGLLPDGHPFKLYPPPP